MDQSYKLIIRNLDIVSKQKLLQKIEELTLYILQQEEKIQQQELRIKLLETKQIKTLYLYETVHLFFIAIYHY